MWIYVSVFNSIPLTKLSVFMPIPRGFCYSSSVVQLKIRMVIPSEFHLLCRIVLVTLGFLLFYMKLHIVLSSSIKNCVGILMEIALNLQITFGRVAVFNMLILPIHKHGRSFHPSDTFFNFFLQILEIFAIQAFHMLAQHYPI